MAAADLAEGWWSVGATSSNMIPKHTMQIERQPRGSGYVAMTAPERPQQKGKRGFKGKSNGTAYTEGREKGKAEGRGKSEGPRTHTAQTDALQGLWEEAGRAKKRWLIKGCTATEVKSGGQMGR